MLSTRPEHNISMKRIGITEETIQYIKDSIYSKIIENDKIPVPDSSQIKLDYTQLSDLVLPRIPKPKNGNDYVLTDKDKKIISNEVKESLIKEIKTRLDNIEKKLNEDRIIEIVDEQTTERDT